MLSEVDDAERVSERFLKAKSLSFMMDGVDTMVPDDTVDGVDDVITLCVATS